MNPFHVTGSELADILGLTPTRITQLAKEGMPRLPQGGFDLRAAAGWYCSKLRNQAESARSELAAGRARLATARATREELALAVEQGELVRADEVRDSAFTVSRLCRDNLLTIPDRLSSILVGLSEHEAHALMMAEIRRSLTAFADQCRVLACGAEGEPMPGNVKPTCE